MNRAIGVFDSGIGGLTVVKELKRQLPNEDIIYLGDTARVPYGTKSASTVVRFSIENILFLLRHNVKLIVVACNTASSLALKAVRRHFKVPIIGVISPGAKEAARVTKNNRVGIIGTPATIKSRAYELEIKKINPGIKILSYATPLFVPLVEEGWLSDKATLEIAKKYLRPLKQQDIDTLILGCTHYPLLKRLIKKIVGPQVALVDSARQVASDVGDILINRGLLDKFKRVKKTRQIFYVTDEPDNFAKLARKFLGSTINRVRKVQYYV